MERVEWAETGTDEDPWLDSDDMPCLALQECVQELLHDAEPGCVYCKFEELEQGDDE